MGLTAEELGAWFAGQSHAPWQRMANIKGLFGPPSPALLAAQAALGVQVVAAMRAYGMTPVLPGFGGHVPDALARVRPRQHLPEQRLGRRGV
jgi:alpha-N-acetylglucosaminidase